jgi:sugar transferase (PEP-CTERM system associated)
MFRVFQRHAAAAVLFEAMMDGLVGFAAVLLAFVTIRMFPLAALVGAIAQPNVVLAASGFALTTALLESFVGLYRHANLSPMSVVVRLSIVAAIGGYMTYLLLQLAGTHDDPGTLIGLSIVYLMAGLVLVRGGIWLLRRYVGPPRVLIIGTGEEARGAAKDLRKNNRVDRRVMGFYPASADEVAVAVPSSKVFDRSEGLLELVRKHRITEIIVAVREQRGGVMPMQELVLCRSQGVKILDLAGFYERINAEVPIDSLKASWLVYGNGFVQGAARRTAKRLFDLAVSALLLILAAPVMALAAILIKLDSPGPVIYRQERVGLRGRTFWCLKFRSMRTDAEKDGVARWATKNDSRVTRVGAFMRKTRIDELPQLISVLRGDMSMVGPRPERPSFVEQLREHIPYYDLRHGIKPGLTGWAQVRYSYGASIEDARRKHQFDLFYVKNNSIWLDFIVILETVTVVLFREGAQ